MTLISKNEKKVKNSVGWLRNRKRNEKKLSTNKIREDGGRRGTCVSLVTISITFDLSPMKALTAPCFSLVKHVVNQLVLCNHLSRTRLIRWRLVSSLTNRRRQGEG